MNLAQLVIGNDYDRIYILLEFLKSLEVSHASIVEEVVTVGELLCSPSWAEVTKRNTFVWNGRVFSEIATLYWIIKRRVVWGYVNSNYIFLASANTIIPLKSEPLSSFLDVHLRHCARQFTFQKHHYPAAIVNSDTFL